MTVASTLGVAGCRGESLAHGRLLADEALPTALLWDDGRDMRRHSARTPRDDPGRRRYDQRGGSRTRRSLWSWTSCTTAGQRPRGTGRPPHHLLRALENALTRTPSVKTAEPSRMQTHRTGYLWVTLSPTRSGFLGPQHHAQGEPPVTRTRTLQALRAADIMTHTPMTMDITGTVQEAADLMYATDIRHIPVVEHGTLVGMISNGCRSQTDGF